MPDDRSRAIVRIATVLPKRGSDDPDRAPGSARGARGLHHLAAPRMRAQPARPRSGRSTTRFSTTGSGGCGRSTRPSAARSRRWASSISHQIPEFLAAERRRRARELRTGARATPARLTRTTCARRFGRPLHDHGGAGAGAFDAPASGRRCSPAAAPRPSSCSKSLHAFADRLAAMLERYWHEAFAAEWARVEPLLARSILEAGRLLAGAGIWPVLGRLPAHCRVDAGAAHARSSTCRMSTPLTCRPPTPLCSSRASSSGRTCA